jgi:antitoxin (DNA-binding transcriptional repressor) of toxin-antitoxin stability system
MYHMKKRTIRELHLRTSAVISEATEGHTVVITRRGVPVAELRPFRRGSQPRTLPDREAWLASFPQVRGDSGKFLEEDRS